MEIDTVSSQLNNMMRMEANNGSTRSVEKQSLEVTTPKTEANKTPEYNESITPVFINHGKYLLHHYNDILIVKQFH